MEKTIHVVKGKVEVVSQKPKTYGIKIGEAWFNGFGYCPINKFDFVRVEYLKGEFNGKPTCTIELIEKIQSEAQKTFAAEPPEEIVLETVNDLIVESKKYAKEFLADLVDRENFLTEADSVSYVVQVRETIFRELMLDRRTKLIHVLRK